MNYGRTYRPCRVPRTSRPRHTGVGRSPGTAARSGTLACPGGHRVKSGQSTAGILQENMYRSNDI